MKLHTLLGHIDEAESTGDLSGASPVFAVVRNEKASLDSPEAWDAISIVDLEVAAESGSIDLIADASEAATDMTVAALRARAAGLSADCFGHEVFVGQRADGAVADETVPVVEAYGDEHGLGLMSWFEGYEDWLQSQE